MGWTYMHREPGLSDRDFFQGEFGEGSEVLEAGTRDNVCYLACRNRNAPQMGVFAIVCLIDRFGDRRDPYFNFGYKDMDETMGPGYDDCPAKVYALLTPLEEAGLSDDSLKWAAGWREGAEENIARRAAAAAVRKGDIVEFDDAVAFTSGRSYRRFRFVERDTFEPDTGQEPPQDGSYRYRSLVRMPGWRTRVFTHIPA